MNNETKAVDVRANLRMALQHILICCPDETVQKAIEDADDAVAELIVATEQAHEFLCEKASGSATEYRLRAALSRIGGAK